jgi:selenide,water dikinase
MTTGPKQLVLVGGGHTHALLALQLIRTPIKDVDVVMVSDVLDAPYSGMLPGLVAGLYQPNEIHIHLPKLCKRAGIKLIQRRVIHINATDRFVRCEDGTTIPFDLISIDVGSTPSHSNIPGVQKFGIGVKPVPAFLERWQKLCQRDGAKHLAIVGGGAGGCEIALAARDRLGIDVPIEVFTRGKFLLGNRSSKASCKMQKAMLRARIKLHFDSEVQNVEYDRLQCADGKIHFFTDLIWLTQAAAPAWFADCQLPLTSDGFLQTENTLQVVGQTDIFAVGDCATMIHQPRPKAGVYAVRQAPVLFQNINSYISGNLMKDFHPQQHFLSLMKLSGRSALAQKGIYLGSGLLWWYLKDWIDRRFMRMFQNL